MRQFNKRSTAADVLEGVDVTRKTIMITGANSGIGFEAARCLAVNGAHVVLACRNLENAQEAKERILAEASEAHVNLIRLDNADLDSVEQCARQYKENGWPLHALILNAGVYDPPITYTKDGFESTFGINHLAHFYLSLLLVDVLKASAPSRVVVVASRAERDMNAWDHNITFSEGPQRREAFCEHPTSLGRRTELSFLRFSRLTAEDVTWEKLSPSDPSKIKGGMRTYALSKICNILFADEFNQRYSKQGITANSLHPGTVITNIARSSKLGLCMLKMVPGKVSINWSMCVDADRYAARNKQQGAATSVYLATAPEVANQGGLYYDCCQPATRSARLRNPATAKKLWELSEKMVHREDNLRNLDY